jgi:hypothetical protein
MDTKTYMLHLYAGKLSGEASTCNGKIDYRSEHTAIKAANSLNKSGKARHKVEPYPCYFCKGWHVGRTMTIEELLRINAK